MDIRFVAGSMIIGLLCMAAIWQFAPRSAPQAITYGEYERAIAALRKRTGATEEFVSKCSALMVPELKESDLIGTSFTDRTPMAGNICRRFLAVMLDGRLTLAEINDPEGLSFKLIEEAERRAQNPAINSERLDDP
ncbi:hypothetical protein M1D34_29245 (plasmid) [Ensifer sp. D2-11]